MAVCASSSSLGFTTTTTIPRHRSLTTTTTCLNLKPITFSLINRFHRYRIINAIEENQETNQQQQTLEDSPSIPPPPTPLPTELNEKVGDNLWSGVAEEIKEIEWPAFGKVLGITGVVLGVIAGSSLVLLTVNAILAELSDRVFVGRGVQDFFG
ncbi:hypothetical protein ACHQM5_030611 [Ranunculus cassubicifolius]